MTTNKRKVTTRKTRKTTKTKRISKKAEAKAKRQIYLKIAVVLIVVISVLVWFVNSSYWPWPSNAEVGRRLNELIDACMYNENSRGCDSLKNRYNMSFEYCHSLAEIPEIGKAPTVYGVAKVKNFAIQSLKDRGAERLAEIGGTWELKSKDSVQNIKVDTSLPNNSKQKNRGSVYPYYGCVSRIDDIGYSNSEDLIAQESDTIALFGLSKIPQRSVSREGNNCSTNWTQGFNALWNQIPNIETIKNEYQIAFNTYSKCSMLSSLDAEQNKINEKLYNYAHDKTIQLFYKAYDEWTDRDYYDCQWFDKSFHQPCGAASNGSDDELESSFEKYRGTDVETYYKAHSGSAWMLDKFIKDMQQFTTTDYFTSKIVIQ